MKYLIPILLLAACSYEHEHPLTDHDHRHTHEFVKNEPAGITWMEPQLIASPENRFFHSEIKPGLGKGPISLSVWFTEPPRNITVTNIPDRLGLPTVPIERWHMGEKRLQMWTQCTQEQAKAGGYNLAVQVTWHSGGALLRYADPIEWHLLY